MWHRNKLSWTANRNLNISYFRFLKVKTDESPAVPYEVIVQLFIQKNHVSYLGKHLIFTGVSPLRVWLPHCLRVRLRRRRGAGLRRRGARIAGGDGVPDGAREVRRGEVRRRIKEVFLLIWFIKWNFLFKGDPGERVQPGHQRVAAALPQVSNLSEDRYMYVAIEAAAILGESD